MKPHEAIDTCLSTVREEWRTTPPAKRAKWQRCIDALLDARSAVSAKSQQPDTQPEPTQPQTRVCFPDMTATMERHLAEHHPQLVDCLEGRALRIVAETMANAATMVLHGFCLAASLEQQPPEQP